MCTSEDCDKKVNEKQGIERRSFLGAATAAVVGVTLPAPITLPANKSSELLPQQQPPTNALNDPTVTQEMVSFKSGPDIIQGYLARPRKAGRFRAVVVLHGNLHLPEDHRYTAAQLAQVGLVGLAIKRFSRTPELTMAELNRSDREDRCYLSNTFNQQELNDAQAAINFLKSQSFVRGSGVGMVGFCGGGYQSLLLSTRSKDVKSVVAFYAPPIFSEQYQVANDRKPNLMGVVEQIKVPIQGHYGMADPIIPIEDVNRFAQALRKQNTPAEFFSYEGATHGFCDYTRRNYNEAAATLAKRRMLEFLTRTLH